jgi:hypothetical protein
LVVDGVGRLDLRAQLAPQTRLTRRVGEQSGIEEWGERGRNGVWSAIRSPSEDRVQDRGWIREPHGLIDLNQLTQPSEQGPRDRQADLDPLLVADIREGSLDLAAQVPGDSIGRLRSPKGPLLGGQPIGEILELGLQPLGDERLVEPWTQLLHAAEPTS